MSEMVSNKDFSLKVFLMLFVFLLLSAGFFAYNSFFGSERADPTVLGRFEYSAPECLNRTLWIMFFNAGDMEVSNISVFSGNTTYATLDSIEPDSPAAFAIGQCDSIDRSSLMIAYCAGVCVEEPLDLAGKHTGSDYGSYDGFS